MDQMADFGKFTRLMARLCSTMDKFANDELIESWWKALRTVPYLEVERRIEDFIARATETTKWPRPGQFRPADVALAADPKEEMRDRRIREDNERNWRNFVGENPRTGPIRLKMALASRIIATEHPSSPAYAEAEREYLVLETMLGPSGRFSADA